jgi:hypothetical protein
VFGTNVSIDDTIFAEYMQIYGDTTLPSITIANSKNEPSTIVYNGPRFHDNSAFNNNGPKQSGISASGSTLTKSESPTIHLNFEFRCDDASIKNYTDYKKTYLDRDYRYLYNITPGVADVSYNIPNPQGTY